MVIIWDEHKRLLNLKAHGLDFADARDRFNFDDALITPTYPGRGGRSRFVAVGVLDSEFVTMIFSPLGSAAISVVSLRPASRKERTAYATHKAAAP